MAENEAAAEKIDEKGFEALWRDFYKLLFLLRNYNWQEGAIVDYDVLHGVMKEVDNDFRFLELNISHVTVGNCHAMDDQNLRTRNT